jgi:hypothetical protein
MITNRDMLVAGFAVIFSEWGRDFRPPEYRKDYEEFEAFGEGLVPLRVDHRPLSIDHSGHITLNIGRILRFRIVDGPEPVPCGLLALGELTDDGVLRAVVGGQLHSMSMGGEAVEVSLTDRPALSRCKIIGVGQKAVSSWELLTGEEVALPEAAQGKTDRGN